MLRQPPQKNKNGAARGFSLIELMVALTIFSIVMTLSISTLLVLIDANAKAQALSSSMTNLSFALDSMTRNIRTGKDFRCVSGGLLNSSLAGVNADCPAGSTGIAFTPGFEDTWRMGYRLNGTVIEQWIDKPGVDSWVPITSTSQPAAVNVSNLEFVVNGSASATTNDAVQPRITLLIAGSVTNGLDVPTTFKVQSNVTQRVLDY